MSYDWIRPKQHIITVRNRTTGYARQYRCWSKKVIEKVLANQNTVEDVFITKCPRDRLIDTIILDYDNENPSLAWKEAKRLKGYLIKHGHNVFLVDSTNKGVHLYCEIAPVLFDSSDDGVQVKDWNQYFKDFVYYLIHDEAKNHKCLDSINLNAGMNGNIRLIGSRHPSTGKVVSIIDGEYTGEQLPTQLQSKSLVRAYHKAEIVEKDMQNKLKKTKAIGGNDPILMNDLRELLPRITGNELKMYNRGYGYMKCFNHDDHHPSMLVTKSWFNCASCGCKGNIWTLRKMGLVEFDNSGVAKL